MVPVVRLKNVSLSYHSRQGETKALENISFDIYDGEFLSIVGPSGCGKSTVLSVISSLSKPSLGTAEIKNGLKTAYMLQKDHLFEWRTVFSNACLGLELQNNLTKENKERVLDLLNKYGLGEFAFKRPSELSGGMRQRAALIRTLASQADILLLDEPFSALDYQTRLTVSDEISRIIKKERKTAVLVTHDISEAVSLSDRVIILSKRPAVIKSELKIEFSSQYKDSLSVREAPEFKDYFNKIWKELDK